MEIVLFAKEILQNVAEHVASYKLGQSLLRHVDRGLWVVEKSARWAVPPPIDQDEPQQELVRPLPWVFFLTLLIALRVTRESLSLVNLILGKPPVRSIDMVSYVQGKRRYLRTLKYQGNRVMRARTSAPASPSPPHSWREAVRSLVELTMCFRRNSYGNNNTTRSNNEEILVVKRKRSRPEESAVSARGGDPMDRLIEKMMVDLDADSEEDSSITVTHAASLKSVDTEITDDNKDDKIVEKEPETPPAGNEQTPNETTNNSHDAPEAKSEADVSSTPETDKKTEEKSEEKPDKPEVTETKESLSEPEPEPEQPKKMSPKGQTMAFIQQEKSSRKSQKKIANGQPAKGSSRKQKGLIERREADVPVVKITPADSFERENNKRSS